MLTHSCLLTHAYSLTHSLPRFLVGLNLSIKRIIFHTLLKYDGKVNRILTNTEIKQIAGRAGRYNSVYEDGLVTAVSSHDLNIIRNALNSKDKIINKVTPHSLMLTHSLTHAYSLSHSYLLTQSLILTDSLTHTY